MEGFIQCLLDRMIDIIIATCISLKRLTMVFYSKHFNFTLLTGLLNQTCEPSFQLTKNVMPNVFRSGVLCMCRVFRQQLV
jgi:hypothetical protein